MSGGRRCQSGSVVSTLDRISLIVAAGGRTSYFGNDQLAFFAPGHDASVWLEGFHHEVNASQRAAGLATPQEAWWSAGSAPLLDLQAEHDAFRPRETENDLREELGARVSVVTIPDAGHALVPEQPAAVVAALLGWMRTCLAGLGTGIR